MLNAAPTPRRASPDEAPHVTWVFVGTLACVAALLVGGMAAFGMQLGHHALWSDALAYSIPKYAWAAERIAQGALPLWNPYEFGGAPLLATVQPGALYPPVWIVYGLFAPDTAHDVLFALHLLIGAWGALRFARQLGASPAAALLATLWVLNPWTLARLYDLPICLAALAWVPLLLGLGREAVLRPSARAAALLGAVAALVGVAGYPPLAIAAGYACLLSLPFWLREAAGDAHPGWARVAGTLALAGVVAACLCALQLLPAAEWLGLTERASASDTLAEVEAIAQSANPSALRILGVPPVSWADGPTSFFAAYGPLLLAALLLGLALRPQSASVRAIQLLAAVSCLLPFRYLKALPFYDFVRFGLEWTCMSPFFLFLAAALGVEAARRRYAWPDRFVLAGVVVILAGTTAWMGRDVHALKLWHTEARTLPSVPEAALAECGIGPDAARLFWPEGQAFGVPLRARLPSIGGYEPSLAMARVRRVQRALSLPAGGATTAWQPGVAAHPGVAARLGLGCAITSRPAPALEAAGYVRVPAATGGPIVYRNPAALARARIVHAQRVAATEEAALGLLLGGAVDPRTTVILETPQPSIPTCRETRPARASIVAYAPEAVRVEIDTPCPGWLVLADTHAPGWQAHVDGQPRDIHTADTLQRAVRIEPGERAVDFAYRPRGARLGAPLSVAGLVLFGVLLTLPAQHDPLRTYEEGT